MLNECGIRKSVAGINGESHNQTIMKKRWNKYDKKISVIEFLLNYILAPIMLIFWGIWKGISKLAKDILSKSYKIIIAIVATAIVGYLLAYFLRK